MLEYKNILVPVDFSDMSKLAIRKAMSAKSAHQGKLVLMHVIDYPAPHSSAAEAPSAEASEDMMVERAENQLSKLALELNVGDAEQITMKGQAKSVLIEYIKNHNIDLVVMAAHNNSEEVKLLGSTTKAVVQKISCDALVIHG